MKRYATYLFVLTLSLVTTIAYGQPSTTSDTIVLKKSKALEVLQKGLEAKALEAQRDLLLNQVDTLKARISIKEMQIKTINGKVSDLNSIISSKNKIISTQTEQRKILEKNTAALNIQLKKERRKKKWATFLGIFTTSAAVTLYFLK